MWLACGGKCWRPAAVAEKGGAEGGGGGGGSGCRTGRVSGCCRLNSRQLSCNRGQLIGQIERGTATCKRVQGFRATKGLVGMKGAVFQCGSRLYGCVVLRESAAAANKAQPSKCPCCRAETLVDRPSRLFAAPLRIGTPRILAVSSGVGEAGLEGAARGATMIGSGLAAGGSHQALGNVLVGFALLCICLLASSVRLGRAGRWASLSAPCGLSPFLFGRRKGIGVPRR